MEKDSQICGDSIMRTKSTSSAGKHNSSYAILSEDTPWAIKEAYKTLRTNVTLSLPDEGHRIIAFTSAEPHDGKTTNAVNFAISLGQIDKKVLLIDCDMRKPMVATLLEMDTSPGLSDMISGQARARDVLRHSSDHQIDIIPAGNLTPDPTLLLQSDRMKMTIQEFKKVYDYIVVDLPPATVVTDASLLADLIDGFILVVRHNTTDYRSVSDMMEQLGLANAQIIGFVYNDANSGEGHYDYNYGYKKYGYGVVRKLHK